MWTSILSAVPDFIQRVFGVVDQVVTDKDKANEIKLEVLTTLAGKGATSWLAKNAFSMAMLTNFGMVVVLSLFNRPVPDWALIVALLWLAGPLMNVLSKETIGRIMEVFHDTKQRAGADTPAPK
ncbi:MAG: hypothetical protein PHI63_06645 [Patescibacteria group bacterium]|nr:hypothetical protein [Patescibacteria group bacterium]